MEKDRKEIHSKLTMVSWMVMSQKNKCLILNLSYVYNFKHIDVNCKVHITIRHFISTVFFCFAYFICMFFCLFIVVICLPTSNVQ